MDSKYETLLFSSVCSVSTVEQATLQTAEFADAFECQHQSLCRVSRRARLLHSWSCCSLVTLFRARFALNPNTVQTHGASFSGRFTGFFLLFFLGSINNYGALVIPFTFEPSCNKCDFWSHCNKNRPATRSNFRYQ